MPITPRTPSLSAVEGEPLDRPVRLRIGALDDDSTRLARSILRRAAERSGALVVVDLADLDDRHHLTMFALLTRAARAMGAAGGTLLVQHPPQRLATRLAACHIPIVQHASQRISGIEHLTIGALPPEGAVG